MNPMDLLTEAMSTVGYMKPNVQSET
jgi:hypothetical protein